MVISIFSITPQRALQVAFSIPYAGQSSVVLAPKSLKITGPQDLVGLKVGVTRGTGEDGLLTAQAEKYPGINILRFDDYASITQAMLSGQIDAMGGGDYGDMYLKKSVKGEDFEMKYILKSFFFGIGVRKDSPELLQWLNTFIYSMKNDGTLNDLSMKYRHSPLPDAAGLLINSARRRGPGRNPGPLRDQLEARGPAMHYVFHFGPVLSRWDLLLYGLGRTLELSAAVDDLRPADRHPRRHRQDLRARARSPPRCRPMSSSSATRRCSSSSISSSSRCPSSACACRATPPRS